MYVFTFNFSFCVNNGLEKNTHTQIQCKVEKGFQQITNRQDDKKEKNTKIIIRKAIRRKKIRRQQTD